MATNWRLRQLPTDSVSLPADMVIHRLVAATTVEDARWIERLRELHLLTALRIVVIIVVAWALSWLLTRVITRFWRGFHRAQDLVVSHADFERTEQRRRTLSAVVRSMVGALVWLTAVITIIGEVGINLGAFVATATVIGGAVAFGAQTIVRDLLAGFFMVAENQFAVGDVVDTGVAAGVVDRVSLRVTRLIDEEGRVWYLPNGQIVRLANLSQGDGSASVDVNVSLLDDLQQLGSRLVKLANDLRQQPDVAPVLAGPARFVGVEELHADRAVLRVQIPCRPAAQGAVRRAFLAAVADAERRGVLRSVDIEPHPQASTGEYGNGPDSAV